MCVEVFETNLFIEAVKEILKHGPQASSKNAEVLENIKNIEKEIEMYGL